VTDFVNRTEFLDVGRKALNKRWREARPHVRAAANVLPYDSPRRAELLADIKSINKGIRTMRGPGSFCRPGGLDEYLAECEAELSYWFDVIDAVTEDALITLNAAAGADSLLDWDPGATPPGLAEADQVTRDIAEVFTRLLPTPGCPECRRAVVDLASGETARFSAYFTAYPVDDDYVLLLPRHHNTGSDGRTHADASEGRGLAREVRALRAQGCGPEVWTANITVTRTDGRPVVHEHVHLIPRGDLFDARGALK
jgi:diadenosine tetraphosphate (Ap4A) HIT family hydrolase